METDRKLATIRRINKIDSIEGADKIHAVHVDGWQLVSAISNNFKVGDLVLYLEVDSWVPHFLAPFLTKPGQYPKIFNGVEGQRLKTIKLKGTLSQGLLLPLNNKNNDYYLNDLLVKEGDDLTQYLKIQKWEKALPATLMGKVKGNFPDFIPKTNLERIQNCLYDIVKTYRDQAFEVSLKMDGSSMTSYIKDGQFGVCSRNLELKTDDLQNSFCKIAHDLKISSYMKEMSNYYGINFAIQGELIGPGIQGNIHNVKELEYHIFDIYDIDNQKYLNPIFREDFLNNRILYNYNIRKVPILYKNYFLDENNSPELIFEDLMRIADSTKLEGIALKSYDGNVRIKVISNNYLLKDKN